MIRRAVLEWRHLAGVVIVLPVAELVAPEEHFEVLVQLQDVAETGVEHLDGGQRVVLRDGRRELGLRRQAGPDPVVAELERAHGVPATAQRVQQRHEAGVADVTHVQRERLERAVVLESVGERVGATIGHRVHAEVERAQYAVRLERARQRHAAGARHAAVLQVYVAQRPVAEQYLRQGGDTVVADSITTDVDRLQARVLAQRAEDRCGAGRRHAVMPHSQSAQRRVVRQTLGDDVTSGRQQFVEADVEFGERRTASEATQQLHERVARQPRARHVQTAQRRIASQPLRQVSRAVVADRVKAQVEFCESAVRTQRRANEADAVRRQVTLDNGQLGDTRVSLQDVDECRHTPP